MKPFSWDTYTGPATRKSGRSMPWVLLLLFALMFLAVFGIVAEAVMILHHCGS